MNIGLVSGPDFYWLFSYLAMAVAFADVFTFFTITRYTDAAFWDRMAGGLDERCADAWDVESDSDREGSTSPSCPQRHRAVEQGTGLAAVRHGIAGADILCCSCHLRIVIS